MKKKHEPQVGEIWRRKGREGKPEFLVRVTSRRGGDVVYAAVDRKSRQPEAGNRWIGYWHNNFELVETVGEAS